MNKLALVRLIVERVKDRRKVEGKFQIGGLPGRLERILRMVFRSQRVRRVWTQNSRMKVVGLRLRMIVGKRREAKAEDYEPTQRSIMHERPQLPFPVHKLLSFPCLPRIYR